LLSAAMLAMVLVVGGEATTYAVHLPAEQVPPLHDLPQTPQFSGSVFRLAQVLLLPLPHSVYGGELQVYEQLPPEHVPVPLAIEQLLQVEPLMPQLLADGDMQLPLAPPLQQPLAQSLLSHVHTPVEVSHEPFMHWAPEVQPTQAPETHTGVEPEQFVCVAPHEPFDWHVSNVVLVVHCVCGGGPGLHVTHEPLTHTGVGEEQGVAPIHCPHESQLWGVLPMHCTAPGVHTGLGGHEQLPQLQPLVQVCEP